MRACDGRDGFELLGDSDLLAPPLLWSEFNSSLHEASWRREIDEDRAQRMRSKLKRSAVRLRAPRGLHDESWRIADELGWAKTYDAEYVALARLLDCRLVTLDGRLRRGAGRLGFVVGPEDL